METNWFLESVGALTRVDWFILFSTLAAIVIYGVYKTRGKQSTEEYIKGGDSKWLTVGLSVMATQASAVTFLSTPGQAYTDGMEFVQLYFGLHLPPWSAHCQMLPPQAASKRSARMP